MKATLKATKRAAGTRAGFQPVTIKLEITSADELRELYHRTNLTNQMVHANSSNDEVRFPLSDTTQELFDVVEQHLESFDEQG